MGQEWAVKDVHGHIADPIRGCAGPGRPTDQSMKSTDPAGGSGMLTVGLGSWSVDCGMWSVDGEVRMPSDGSQAGLPAPRSAAEGDCSIGLMVRRSPETAVRCAGWIGGTGHLPICICGRRPLTR